MTQRLDWSDLPETVRDAVGQQCGGIKAVTPISGGVNNAVACTLDAGDGALFLKGLRTSDPRMWMYRNEIAAAEGGAPGPTLRWVVEVEEWILLGLDYVEGRPADLAPRSSDLDRIAGALRELADRPPLDDQIVLAPQSRRWEHMRPWAQLAANPPAKPDPWLKANLDRFAEQERNILAVLDGPHLAHTDLHELNVLVCDDEAHLIDWAWARRAAPWVDAEMFTLRLVAAGHSNDEADRWRVANLPVPDLDLETRKRFAVEMLGTWLHLATLRPNRPLFAEMTGHALGWAKHLHQVG